MNQKNLPLFIAISIAILLGSQYFLPHKPRLAPQAAVATRTTQSGQTPSAPALDLAPAGHQPVAVPPPSANAPRLPVDAPRVEGSISLQGARLDDLRLRDYRETVDKNSPLVRLLEPANDPQPSYVQFGWSAAPGIHVPADDTIWTAAGGNTALSANHPVSLSWDNGAGLTFHIDLSIDANFMVSVRQWVHNAGTAPAAVLPWQRVKRDYLPAPTSGGYGGVFEGMIGVTGHEVHSQAYAAAKKEADSHADVAYQQDASGGWSGFTDKYWLTALIPDQSAAVHTTWSHWLDDNADRFQIDYQTAAPQTVAPGADAASTSRVFVGAKEVNLLDRYETRDGIPLLSYSVDWGWLFFISKPIFYVIDWLNAHIGNVGIAILVFTTLVKILFYPIAARSYRSMGKMRLLGPKIQAMRDRYKDDPAKQQSEMMALYKAEQVNPASGCLPMLLQIPVFFALYKVILVTIEMRHAPFFAWVHDLSATDPTNLFTVFGLIPWNPTVISPLLHLGIWPLIMGATMYAQQKLNPPPPDPTQARMLQFMPLIFLFIMGRAPAGLVIYWCWNNLLTIAQQWYIQRSQSLTKTSKVKPA